MIALSVRQPWAWLIFRPDITELAERAAALAAGQMKDIENRDWRTDFRGPLLIHASQTLTKAYHRQSVEDMRAVFGISLPEFEDLPRGGVVGIVTVVDCVEASDSPWFNDDSGGGFGFVLRDARPLPFTPFKGRLGFFDVPRSALVGTAGDVRL